MRMKNWMRFCVCIERAAACAAGSLFGSAVGFAFRKSVLESSSTCLRTSADKVSKAAFTPASPPKAIKTFHAAALSLSSTLFATWSTVGWETPVRPLMASCMRASCASGSKGAAGWLDDTAGPGGAGAGDTVGAGSSGARRTCQEPPVPCCTTWVNSCASNFRPGIVSGT